MSLETTVRAGRAAAERLMSDTLRVTRTSARQVNSETGKLEPTEVVIYEGRGSISGFDAYERTAVAAGHEYTLMRPHVIVPVDAADVRENDMVEVTASRLRAAMVGRKFRIAGDPIKTSDIRRRLPAEEVL